MNHFHNCQFPLRFHAMMYEEDPDDLVIEYKPMKPKFTGPCGTHMRFYGTELMLERDCVPSKGYYTCEDCKIKLREERERREGYSKGGYRLRAS